MQRVELTLLLNLWRIVIGLGKAVLLVLVTSTLISSHFFLFSIPLPSVANHANVLDIYSLVGVLGIVALCAYVEFLFLFLDLNFC